MGFNKRYVNTEYIKDLSIENKWKEIINYLRADALIFSGEEGIKLQSVICGKNEEEIINSIKKIYKTKKC